MSTPLQKLTTKLATMALFFLLLLPSIFATEISLPGYQLPGNYQYYQVIFDEEGEATVILKLMIHNPQPQIILEIPGNVQISNVVQEVFQQEQRWNAKYLPLAWNQRLSSYEITLADPFQQTATLLLSYKAQGYVQKELGEFHFNFPTIKWSYTTDSVRAAVNVQPDLHLKGVQGKVNYVNNFFLSKTIAHEEMSSISQRMMYTQGLVKEAYALDPFENFVVSGEYGKSLLWLYRWEVIGGTVSIFVILFLLLFAVKKLKRVNNKSAEVIVWGAFSSFFSLSILASMWWIMDNLRRWVGYRLDGFIALLLVFSAAITLLALLLLPSLYLGKKYGYKTGFLTAAAMVGWMLMMSTVTLFFIA